MAPDRRVAVALAAYSGALVGWLLWSGMRVTRDDGFYYFKIAQNVAAGTGSTFDGLHVTNGYHPLWLMVLVPIFWLAPEAHAALQVGIVLQGLLLAAGVALLYRAARLRLAVSSSALAALLWVGLAYREALSGVEFSLQACCVLAVAFVYLRWFCGPRFPGPSRCLGLGLLLAASALARLDNFVLAVMVWAWSAFHARRSGLTRTGVAGLTAVALPVGLAACGAVAVNLWLCGHALPVSAAVKREWSAHLLLHDPYYQAGGFWLAKAHQLSWPLRNLPQRYPLSLTLGTLGVAVALLAGRAARGGWREGVARGMGPWTPFAAFSALQLVGYGIVYHGEVSFAGSPWYYVVQPLLASVLVATVIEGMMAPSPGAAAWRGPVATRAPILAMCLVALWTAWSLKRWRDRDIVRFTHEAADWIRHHLPADARVGSWHAGAIGYLSGRQVIGLDGLVNSWDYFLSEQHDLCGYWDRTGIAYLADMFDGTRAAVPEPAQASYERCAGRFEHLWSDATTAPPWRIAVYRIRPAAP